jgi:hypothetical protein
MLTKLFQFVLTGALIAFVHHHLQKRARSAALETTDGWCVMTPPRELLIIHVVGIIFFGSCLVLCTLFPGKTQNLFLAQAIFAIILLLTLVSLMLLPRARYRWNDAELVGRSRFGAKEVRVLWSSVVSFRFSPGLQSFILVDSTGTTAYVPASYFMGVPDFLRKLSRHKDKIQLKEITWKEIESLGYPEAS